jgi:pimeloyl-ACP methyl ester carboxylesterase
MTSSVAGVAANIAANSSSSMPAGLRTLKFAYKQYMMHSLMGGDKPSPTIVLVHGADRKLQNCRHWTPHFEWLRKKGTLYALDLLGHGDSTPGVRMPLHTAMPMLDQVEVMANYFRAKIPSEPPFIFVGRSYGGKVLMELAKRHAALVRAMVLIAPALDMDNLKQYSSTVWSKPTLLVGAEDDPLVPYSNLVTLSKSFANGKLVSMGKINPPAEEKWRAHTPENEKVEEFHKVFDSFFDGLNLSQNLNVNPAAQQPPTTDAKN